MYILIIIIIIMLTDFGLISFHILVLKNWVWGISALLSKQHWIAEFLGISKMFTLL